MIDTLTPEQDALLVAKREEWLSYGLSTEPADRPAAEEGVRMAYRAAGLEPPRVIVWLDSPLAGAVGRVMVPAAMCAPRAQVVDRVGAQVWAQVWAQVGDQVGDQVRAQVGDQVGAQVWDRVVDRVGAQVWDRVGDQVGAQVWDRVGDQVWAQVGDQVWAQVGAQVGDQVGDRVRAQVGDQVRAQVGGFHLGLIDQWVIYWSALVDVAEGIGVTGLRPFDGIKQVSRTAGWWWCFKDFAIITERPVALHRDAQTRLHCETGPALAYRDEFALHCWHGVRVPADLITDGWSVERIFAEGNAEIRRCAIERMGWPRFIRDAGLTQVGADVPDPGNPGQTLALYRLPKRIFDGGLRARVLVCTNATVERDGSRHQFGITVPASIQDPVAAAAWTFNLNPSEYAALQRAC